MMQKRRWPLGKHELANHMNNGLGDQLLVRRGYNNYNDGYRGRMQQQEGMYGNYGRYRGMMKDPQLSVPTNRQIGYGVPFSNTFDATGPVNFSNPSSEKWIYDTPPAQISNSFGGFPTQGTSQFFDGYNQMYDSSAQFNSV